MKKTLRFSAITIAIAALTHTATALELTLGFNTLPSTQGWLYSATGPTHGGQIEGNIWNANGLRLAMNTMGSGLVSPSGNTYVRNGEVNAVDPIVIEWTSRVLQNEGTIPTASYGWCLGVTTGIEQAAVGFRTNSITLGSAAPVAFDTTGFHDYRLEFTPGAPAFSLFVDGGLFASTAPDPVALNRIFFGDGSGAANARAEMTAYTFTQVPEPAGAALFAAGAMMFAARRRRRAASGPR